MLRFSLDTMDGILHDDGFLIVFPCSGGQVTLPNMLEALARARQHFQKPYGLIFDRVQESAMDFPNYPLIAGDAQVCGIALVSPEGMGEKVAPLESRFFGGKPCRVFTGMEPARSWLRGFQPATQRSAT